MGYILKQKGLFMKPKFFMFVIFVGSYLSIHTQSDGLSYVSNPGAPSVLHIALHKGCIKDMEEVAKALELFDLTSWYVPGMNPRSNFDGFSEGNYIWTITHDRAENIWDRHKEFFEQFDIIMTSDIAPLSRIFLQNNHWKKPLIIWVCNRFDYCDWQSRDGAFPDQEYYQMFQEAEYNPFVRIIPYTNYEWHYAQRKGIDINRDTITPIGSLDDSSWFGSQSQIPADIACEQTLFIYPRLQQHQLDYAQKMCKQLDLPAYSGFYNGPGELKSFKAVLYFPYAWSNLALFEDLQRGIVHFVPSPSFIKKLVSKGAPVKKVTLSEFQFCEWYREIYKDVIVYFDSWQDLKEKFNNLNYDQMQKRVKAFGTQLRAEMLDKWDQVFTDLFDLI